MPKIRLKAGMSLTYVSIFLAGVLFIGLLYLQTSMPKSLLLVNTMFLSILLEAFPFILIGVFASALIQIYMTEEMVQRFIPKTPLATIIPAVLVSAIFPVCECAIILVVRRLIKKGMPLHGGMIFIVGAPILNPIVFASTYYAFQSTPIMTYARMGIAFAVAILIGCLVYLFFKNQNQMKWTTEELLDKSASLSEKPVKKRFKSMLYHAIEITTLEEIERLKNPYVYDL